MNHETNNHNGGAPMLAPAKYIPLIAMDFIATNGERTTCFQFCRYRNSTDRLESVANITFCGEATETLVSDSLKPRARALVRLAQRYQSHSIPQRFTK